MEEVHGTTKFNQMPYINRHSPFTIIIKMLCKYKQNLFGGRLTGPPVAALPAYTVLAEIFGFFDNFDAVMDLLKGLSKSTRKYADSSHKQMLSNVCVHIKRQIANLACAGPAETIDVKHCERFQCISERATRVYNPALRVSSISVCLDPVVSLMSLQIEVTDGEKSAKSAVYGDGRKPNCSIQFNREEVIQSVGIKYFDGEIFGIRCELADGTVKAVETGRGSDKYKWYTRQLKGRKLVGFHGHTRYYSSSKVTNIVCLGLII